MKMRRLGEAADAVADLLPIGFGQACRHARSWNRPRDSEHSRRCDNSSWLISSENNDDRQIGLDGGVRGHAERERCLAHGGAGADDDQRTRLHPAQDVVEVDVARRRAGDRLAPLVELLEAIEVGVEQIADLRHRVGDPTLADFVDERLGLVDRLDHVVGLRVARSRRCRGRRR